MLHVVHRLWCCCVKFLIRKLASCWTSQSAAIWCCHDEYYVTTDNTILFNRAIVSPLHRISLAHPHPSFRVPSHSGYGLCFILMWIFSMFRSQEYFACSRHKLQRKPLISRILQARDQVQYVPHTSAQAIWILVSFFPKLLVATTT